MRIDVTGRHLDVTTAIEEYANDKCSKLPKFYDGVQQIEAILEKRPHDEFEVELRVDVEKHETFISKADGHDIYKCIDFATDKMIRQLTDFKERLKNNKR